MASNVPSGSFSLFPSTGRPPSRTQGQRQQSPEPVQTTQTTTTARAQPQAAAIGEAVTAGAHIMTPPPVTDDPPADPAAALRSSSVRSRSSIAKMRLSLYDDRATGSEDTDPVPPMPAMPGMPSSSSSSSSPPPPPPPPPPSHRPPALRSIFPQYNPDLPLDQQAYFPTQTSPTRIPRAVISRPLYSPGQQQQEEGQEQQHQQQQQHQQYQQEQYQHEQHQSIDARAQGPASIAAPSHTTTAAPRPWQPAATATAATAAVSVSVVSREAPTLPEPSTTDELRSFWKVANGWKVGPSEGRVYCLAMRRDGDAPVYRLSSRSQQPFYRLRLDPTSMSAYVTLARHDPGRAFGEGRGANGDNSTVASETGDADALALRDARLDRSKHWQTALTTTLEPDARRHRPDGDGLVALLYPAAAARMALARPQDAAVVATAERECARLVWDDDSGHYFVVHPALALPFCVTIARSAAWSRTAYTLEHLESPQHVARLTTRDGTGGGTGFLEVDVGVAAQIDAAYLVDAVVAALVLVAHSDHAQQFAAHAQAAVYAPPPVHLRGASGAGPELGAGSELGAGTGAGPYTNTNSPHASLVNLVLGGVGRSASRLSGAAAAGGGSVQRDKKARKNKLGIGRLRPLEPSDVDLESQTSIDLSGKLFEMGPMDNGGEGVSSGSRKRMTKTKDKDKDKLPGCLRLVAGVFKCGFWCLSLCVRAVFAIVRGLFQCLTHEKL